MFELTEFLDDRDRSPFAEWHDSLDASVKVRITIALSRLASGNLAAVKSVGSGVLEMRLDFGAGLRIYLARDGDRIILLLGGGTKQRQSDDIESAKTRWRQHKARKREKS